ncbi:sucrase-isomaltase, intestinal-like [Ostrinia nubilalis]
MVTPLLERGASTATPLFPGPHDWHHIRTGTSIGHGRKAVVDEDHTVTVRGGAIIPLQEPPARGPVTTTAARSGPLQLLAAPDRARQAEGQLYWDDGDSLNSYDEKKFSHIKFTLNRNILSSRVVWWGYGVPSINNITIFNQPTVVSVTVKGASAHFEYLEKTKVLQIYNINLSLDNPFEVQWLYKAKQNKAISINSPYVPKSG